MLKSAMPTRYVIAWSGVAVNLGKSRAMVAKEMMVDGALVHGGGRVEVMMSRFESAFSALELGLFFLWGGRSSHDGDETATIWTWTEVDGSDEQTVSQSDERNVKGTEVCGFVPPKAGSWDLDALAGWSWIGLWGTTSSAADRP